MHTLFVVVSLITLLKYFIYILALTKKNSYYVAYNNITRINTKLLGKFLIERSRRLQIMCGKFEDC